MYSLETKDILIKKRQKSHLLLKVSSSGLSIAIIDEDNHSLLFYTKHIYEKELLFLPNLIRIQKLLNNYDLVSKEWKRVKLSIADNDFSFVPHNLDCSKSSLKSFLQLNSNYDSDKEKILENNDDILSIKCLFSIDRKIYQWMENNFSRVTYLNNNFVFFKNLIPKHLKSNKYSLHVNLEGKVITVIIFNNNQLLFINSF